MEESISTEQGKKMNEGMKYDKNKQGWYPMPLVILKPLADVFLAGEKKYETFNCLKPFEDSDRRFWDAMMRHLMECQIDPLAIDKEIFDTYGIKVYHGAQAVFNILMRIHNAERKIKENSKREDVK